MSKAIPGAALTGYLITPDGSPGYADIEWSDGVISSVRPRPDLADDPAVTHELPIVLPGFADLHNHGGAGYSFPTDGYEECRIAARHHRGWGSTTLLASTVSLPPTQLLPQLELLANLADAGEIAGIHAEGPFINHHRCGAQNPAAIIPGDPALFAEMIAGSRGHLRSMTFAPETSHARQLVDLCAEHNIIVSLGHTDADYATTAELIDYALDQGALVTATHLFNAMPGLHHRAPGPVAALLNAAKRNRAIVELVADGVHLSDDTVELVRNTAGAESVTFVSDAMGAAGKADGNYTLGALTVTVTNGVARLTTADGSEGAIAGGTSHVLEQWRRHLQNGWDVQAAVQAATSGATLLFPGSRGSVRAGMRADLVVLTNPARSSHTPPHELSGIQLAQARLSGVYEAGVLHDWNPEAFKE